VGRAVRARRSTGGQRLVLPQGRETDGPARPTSGRMAEVRHGPRLAPAPRRRAPDGMLWIALYGNGKLAKLGSVAMKVVKTYQLPAGDGDRTPSPSTARHGLGERDKDPNTVVRLDPRRADAVS